MNKKLLITLITCCIALNMWSQVITDSLARAVAQNLMLEKLSITPSVVNCKRIASKSKSEYWLVSFNDGWVLVATSSQNHPVIAYNTSGRFSDEIAPLQLLGATLVENSILAKKEWLRYTTPSQIHSKRAGVQALVTTQWGQSAPYNLLCPADVDGKNGHALVGCGATALAQLLNYYKWPSSGHGSNSYIPLDNPRYGVQSVDFSKANYAYPIATDAQKAQISYHAGVAVSMNYGPLGSSSNPQGLARALITNFKYSPSLRIANRKDYTEDAWKQLIKSELNAQRPVLYSANDSAKSYGHFFIVDGYDDNDMFHCNWGWFGKSDGYFSLNSLNPDIYSFNSNDLIIIGIQPLMNSDYKPDFAFLKVATDDSVVVNNSYLASQSVAELLSNRRLFFHFNATNQGNVDLSETVALTVYVDGKFYNKYTKESLNLFYDTWFSSTNYGFFSAGTHSIKFVIDEENKFDELDESNNTISKTFTVLSAPQASNLCLQKSNNTPNGFFCSKLRNGVASTSFSELDSLFLHIQLANFGNLPVKTASTLSIFVDNILAQSLTIDSIPKSNLLTLQNIIMERLSVGKHTVKLVLDANNQLTEGDETDNVYTGTITVLSKASLPNLTFTKLSSWASSIIVSDTTGTNQHMQSIKLNKSLYVDFAFKNNGLMDIKTPMSFMLVVDGKDVVYASTSTAPLYEDLYFRDIELSALSEGVHTIGVRLDCFDAVAEQFETDNYIEISIRVGNFPDLKFLDNSGLTITRDRKVELTQNNFTVSDSVFVSASIENASNVAITKTIKAYLLVDDVKVDSLLMNGLAANTQYRISNLKTGKLAEGNHQLSVKIDADELIYEVSELNNISSQSLYVFKTVPIVDLFFYKQGNDSISITNVRSTREFKSDFLLGDTLFMAFAVANISNEDLFAPFSINILVDNVLFKHLVVDTIRKMTYTGLADIELAKLSAGTHTVQFIADADNAVGEAKEYNNVVTRQIIIKDTASNIMTFTPQNWSSGLVVACKKQDYVGAASFVSDSVLYANFAFKNSETSINKAFIVELLLDGVSIKKLIYTALTANQYYKVEDVVLGKLAEGSHTLSLRIDSESQIVESDEMDNVLDFVITVNKSLAVPAKASKPVGKAVLCMNQASASYSTQDVATAESYVWQIWPNTIATLSSNGSSTNLMLMPNASGSVWIKVAARNASGIGEFSDSLEITVQAKLSKPKLNTNATASICEGKSLSLSTTEKYVGIWSTGTTASSIEVSVAGQYWIVVTDPNACFTQNSDTVDVAVLAKGIKPIITKGGETALCQGKTLNLVSPQGDSYKWSTGAETQSISVSDGGKYWVEVKDASGCYAQNSDTVEVSVVAKPAKPILTVAGTTSLCEGQSVSLSSSIGKSYTWNIGDQTQSISVSTGGKYWAVVSDASGCYAQNSDTVEVSVVAKPAKPILTVAGTTSLCEGQSVSLSSSIGKSYTWNIGDQTQSISVSTGGKYWAVVSDASGCYAQNSDTVEVTVVAKPAKPSLTVEGTTSLCEGQSVSLSSSIGKSYTWNTGDKTQSISVSTGGKYWAVVSDASGCYTQNTDTITIDPIVPLTRPIITMQNNKLTVSASTATVKWYDNQTKNICAEDSFTFSPQNSGQYIVSLTDTRGCIAWSDSYVFTKTPINQLTEDAIIISVIANKITITTNNALITSLTILTELGQPVLATALHTSEYSSETLRAGVYIVSLVIENQLIARTVIVQ